MILFTISALTKKTNKKKKPTTEIKVPARVKLQQPSERDFSLYLEQKVRAG